MKKELFLPLIIFALTLVFAVICLMVYLSKGNAYWIKRKLKIGALLLTFNAIVYGTSGQDSGCYIAPAENIKRLYFGPIINTNDTKMRNAQLQTDKINLQNNNISDIDLVGYGLGMTYEEHLGNLEETLSSFIFNLYYNKQIAFYTEDLGYEIVEDKKSNLVKISKTMDLEYFFSNVTLDLLYKQNFTRKVPVGLVGGFYISLPIYSKAKEKLVQSVPESAEIEINEKETLFYGDIKDHSRFDFGTKILIQYEIFLDRAYIIPSFGWSYSFTDIVPKSDWTQSSWITNISIRWAF